MNLSFFSVGQRIFWNIVILVSIFSTPYYVYLILIILGILVFGFFWESIFYALFLDKVFSTPMDFMYHFTYVHTLTIFLILWGVVWVKKNTI